MIHGGGLFGSIEELDWLGIQPTKCAGHLMLEVVAIGECNYVTNGPDNWIGPAA